MGKVFKYIFLTVVFISVLSIIISFFLLNKELNKKIEIPIKKEIYIERGTSLKDISKKLEKENIISNKEIFYYYARFKGIPLKHGFYIFQGRYSIPEVWEILAKGKESLVKLTIIPGENLFDIAKKVNKKFGIKEYKFLAFVFNPANLKRFDLTGISFEGFIPPETYTVRKNISLEELIYVFISFFKDKYLPLLETSKDFSPYETMIIASMVEKETALEEEKPVIAGVIINRLKRNMLLQIDPTTIYALKLAGKWNGKLTKKNIHFDSPFNTYVYKGLPPTPICSFSLSSLKAVLNYKKTDFLYYLTKDGKKHIFSKTYKDHINALRGYRK